MKKLILFLHLFFYGFGSGQQAYLPKITSLAEVQFSLGNAYRDGNGVKQSYSMAIYWWQEAAHQGLAKAQFNLGFIHHFGKGVEQSYSKAI